MKDELKWAIYLIGLGASLVVYAHVEFATKDQVKTMRSMLETIDKRVYDLHSKLYKER